MALPKRATRLTHMDTASTAARLALAVMTAKVVAVATRAMGRGGGTALPGLVATRLYPTVVRDLSSQLKTARIIVTGTNGKTTTSRLLGEILAAAAVPTLRNQSGSNLMRGLASSLVSQVNILGRVPKAAQMAGLFEVDEAAFPEVMHSVDPTAVLFLNLFRDQLDRYGEVATVARLWCTALLDLPPGTAIIANADDPLVVDVTAGEDRQPLYFGIDSASVRLTATDHASDVKACPRCGGSIRYDAVFLGHLGHFTCGACGLRRPPPAISAGDVTLNGVDGSTFTLRAGSSEVTVDLPIPGLYNVYNALAAAAGAMVVGIGIEQVAEALRVVTPAFGRMERLHIEERDVILSLAKNPAGLNQVLHTIVHLSEPVTLLLMLNDRIADGHDVSWIWDADLEVLQGHVSTAVFSGTRAADIALRCKYAGLLAADQIASWSVEADPARALRQALDRTPPHEKLFIVPTYTAMLDVRAELVAWGYVRPYWEN